MAELKPYLEAGEFTTTHGIRGELRLYPWCDEPAFLADFTTLYLDAAGKKRLENVEVRPHKNICVVRLPGVDSIEQARAYIGKTVYIARADVHLEPGHYFVQDLLGATVRDADTGEDYGVIRGVSRPGRHDIYEVERPGGEVTLFPAAQPFIESTDITMGLVLVRPIHGMFNDPSEGR